MPLVCACGAFDKLPFIFEQHFQIAHVPFGGVRLPRAFNTTTDCICANAAAMAALPAEALFFDTGGFGFRPDEGCIACAMCFTESMSASYECNSFFVVHCHAS